MKSIKIIALAFMASAICYTAQADNKKNKKQAVATVTEVVKPELMLQSFSDSVSYAAGRANAANGLMPYLQQQLGVDTAYIDSFVTGLREAMDKGEDKAFIAYKAGFQIAELIKQRMLPSMERDFGPDGLNKDVFMEGFVSFLNKNDKLMNDSLATAFHQESANAARKERTAKLRAAGENYLAENAKKPGVIVTESGLQYKVVKEGTGEKPKATDKVKVKYKGMTIDGKVFDASDKHSQDGTTFGVSDLIRGWSEGLTLMPVGSVFEFYIPENLAYGERGAGKDIPPYAALIFEVELLSIEK